MNSFYKFARKMLLPMLAVVLTFTGVVVAGPTAKAAASPSTDAYVYYVSDGDLYRVRMDGTSAQKIRDNFFGVELKPAGDYLFQLFDEKSTTLLKLSMVDSKAKAADFSGDKRILHYVTEGNFVYCMDDKGGIYRVPAEAKKVVEGTLIADMADTKHPGFTVLGGKVYYNALKNGRTTWVASKSADGSGAVQWIASGALQSPYYIHKENNTLYLMVDTKPTETEYSLNSMVLYTMPVTGGTAKALNPKAPLDANAVLSGSWAGDYYLFNKGIRVGSDSDFDYTKGKGFLLDKAGKIIQLNQTGVYEIAALGGNRFAYVDAKGKAYVSTLASGKIANTKAIALNNVGYVRNLISDGKVRSTVLFAESGAYVLNSDLSLTKMVGVEWDLCVYKEDVAGVFYVNAGDNGRLYWMSEDGKTTKKLTDEKVSRIVLISKN
ncbi:DUF5050 domain-containing protein [Paenibacillus sp. CAA11]|uniref:DUF5050 domain-containing protein n=1 Tax=Paenibacillus sp. CAA11 TaxID=1532905 RepID=UPI000D34843F|nr:DUF5050 domain-containing protein [Paenibacillus sp. CAA11]AWB43803.1 DUF5050 domain-containing protein [Paenibacillus sp. CAA11]